VVGVKTSVRCAGPVRRALAAAVVLAAAGLLMLSSCSDALLDEMARLAVESNQADISPSNGSIITAHEIITLTFTKAMDPSTVAVTGDFSAVLPTWPADGGNKEMKLNDLGAVVWPSGAGKTLTVTVTSGGQTVTSTYTYEVFRGVCVSIDDPKGDDAVTSTCGRALKPLKSIPAGIAAVQQSATYGGVGEVRIAIGTYTTNWAAGTGKISVPEGVSLRGGYDASWTTRTILPAGKSLTVVRDDSSGSSSTLAAPTRAIDCLPGVTTATVVEGLTVYGGQDSFSAALFCSVASPTLRYNTFIGAGGGVLAATSPTRFGISLTASSNAAILSNDINYVDSAPTGGGTNIHNSYGIYVDGSAPAITSNRIYAGTASQSTSLGTHNACALLATGDSAVVIDSNEISGGTACRCWGIRLLSGGIVASIRNNLLVAGSSIATGASSKNYGIDAFSVPGPVIRNNTFQCSRADTVAYSFYTLFMSTTSDPTIENNVFTGVIPGDCPSYGIYVVSGSVVSVKNNDFSVAIKSGGGSTAWIPYHVDPATDYATVAAMETALGGMISGGNAADDPLLDSSFRPTGSSPASIRTGGLVGVSAWGFDKDRNGMMRTPAVNAGGTGWSMGCYEY
jgi:hypothetical protein